MFLKNYTFGAAISLRGGMKFKRVSRRGFLLFFTTFRENLAVLRLIKVLRGMMLEKRPRCSFWVQMRLPRIVIWALVWMVFKDSRFVSQAVP